MHFYGVIPRELGFHRGLVDHFRDLSFEPGFFQRVLHRGKIVRAGDDLDAAIVIADHVFRTGVDGGLHHFIFRGAGREHQLPAMLELIRDTAVGAHIAAMFGEGVAHIGDRAHFVVGEAIHHHRRAAYAVAFIARFFIGHAFQLAGAAFDGAIDVVARHVFGFAFVDGEPQARVVVWVAAAHAGSHGDFFNQAGKNLAAFGVLAPFAVLNICPFGMTGHSSKLP